MKSKRIPVPAQRVTFFFLFLLLLPCAVSYALNIEVTYSPLTCSKPVTFTVTADGTDQCVYAMSGISRWFTDSSEWVLEVDPSMGAYKTTFDTSNTFNFQFLSSGKYWMKFTVMDKGTTPYQSKSQNVFITIDDSNYPAAETLADQIAAACLKAGCTTDYDKALWLHDWLIANSDYDYTYSFCSANAALTGNKGTCESYHRAYSMLLDRVGVENSRVTGNGHVWTGVKMNGKWYQVDVTWDDTSYNDDFYKHLYFGLTDDLMASAHSDHKADTSRPCNSYTDNYFIHSGTISDWSDPVAQYAQQSVRSFVEAPTGSSLPSSTKLILYTLAAQQLQTQTISGMKPYFTCYDSTNDNVILCLTKSKIELPVSLKALDTECFSGVSVTDVILPDGTETINSKVFGSSLEWIKIPSSVTSIAEDAISSGAVILCPRGSEAQSFAIKHGYKYYIVP